MPAHSPTLRQAVAKAGAAARGGDPERVLETKRDLAAERIAAYVERVVAQAPPLSPEQRDRLALLLRGTGAAA